MALRESAVVLLGAGASSEANIPLTAEMTEVIVKRIAGGHRDQGASALHFVCGALLLYDAARGASPYDGLDVERVFAAVGLLAERHELEVSPFVSSWHPAVDHWDQTSRQVPPFWDKNFARALARGGQFSDAGKVADLVEKVTGGSPTGEVYNRLAQRMLNELSRCSAILKRRSLTCILSRRSPTAGAVSRSRP